MKVHVSSHFCATGAIVLASLALSVWSLHAAEPGFHHGDWPFNSPVRPVPPRIDNPAWATNPIDHFVAAGLAKAGLLPAPQADRNALLRRVTYDLIGLPPTA